MNKIVIKINSFSPILSVFILIWVCEQTCLGIWLCIVICAHTCMLVCGGQKTASDVILKKMSIFLRLGLLLVWNTPIHLGWLLCMQCPENCCCLFNSKIRSTCHCTWSVFVGSGNWTQIFMLTRQALCPLCYLSSIDAIRHEWYFN